MTISNTLLRESIKLISAVSGVSMSVQAMVADVVLLAKVWPEESDFKAAVASSIRAIEQARDSKITPDILEGSYEGWLSYHYQLRRKQGMKATLRLIYRNTAEGIEVKGFGHRFRPLDIYHRIVEAGR